MASYLVTFVLAVASVGLWTVRVTVTSRGNRLAGSIVSTIEATTYVLAVSHVIGELDAPIHVAIYALGVWIGTYLGITVDHRMQESRQERERCADPSERAPALLKPLSVESRIQIRRQEK